MKRSIPAFWIMLFLIVMSMFLFGTLIWFVEKGQWMEENHPTLIKLGIADREAYVRNVGLIEEAPEWAESPFRSIIHSFWWVVVTITTVGYGDVYPTSRFGKVIATAAILCGVILLAMPIGVIGTNFNAEFDQMVQDRQMREDARKRKERREKLRRMIVEDKGGKTDPTSPESSKSPEKRIPAENLELAAALQAPGLPAEVDGTQPLEAAVPPRAAKKLLGELRALRRLRKERRGDAAERIERINDLLLTTVQVVQSLPEDPTGTASSLWLQRAVLRAVLLAEDDEARLEFSQPPQPPLHRLSFVAAFLQATHPPPLPPARRPRALVAYASCFSY
jgi:hypothetical protein